MHPLSNIAITAARAAGNVILQGMNQLDRLTIETKHHNDFVSNIDRAAEQEIIEIIHKAYPDHAILGEESGQLGDSSEVTWIIDPLDGTSNYIRGVPHFAVSIAVRENGIIRHAVIFDPIRDELFTASRGQGARLNNQRLRVSTRRELGGSMIATGIPSRDFTHLQPYLQVLNKLIPQVGDIRRNGAAALDLAYVAAGRFDGFWEIGLQLWDFAAGVLLIKEAGGLISDFAGGEDYLTTGDIVTGNPRVFKALLQRIQPVLGALSTVA